MSSIPPQQPAPLSYTVLKADPPARRDWPAWVGQLIVVAIVATILIFGAIVVIRSAYSVRRMTDSGVYFRAAWAVRTSQDIYFCTDDNGWHYVYPALVAILLTPLADPPATVPRHLVLPFGVSAGFWYAISIACLILSIHWLAASLENAAPEQIRKRLQTRRIWWALRVGPSLICVIAIGSDLSRGQVDLLILALLSGTAISLMRRQSWRAGLFLAGAICIKVVPAFLLVYPIWRRDLRMLLGCAIGLFVGLILIPSVVFGPTKAWNYNTQFADFVLHPGVDHSGTNALKHELIGLWSTDNHSIMAIVHHIRTSDMMTRDRPPKPANSTLAIHWSIGGVLTLATLFAAGWSNRQRDPFNDQIKTLLTFSTLICILLLITPVCHLQQFMLALPRVTVLCFSARERRTPRWPAAVWITLLIIYIIANTITHIPGTYEVRRAHGFNAALTTFFMDTRLYGLATAANLMLVLMGIDALLIRQREPAHFAARI